MYKIIKVEPNGSRFHIYLDNNIDFLLYKGEVKRFKIVEGACIGETQYKAITDILYKRARERALYILDKAYKTEKQIFDKLKAGFYPQFIIDRVIEYLKEYDLINDSRYAAMYIEDKSSSKSRKQIVHDLYLKGISKNIIDDAFEVSDFSEEYSLEKVIEKKVTRYNLKDKKDAEKFYRYLIGKGYRYMDIQKALSKYDI